MVFIGFTRCGAKSTRVLGIKPESMNGKIAECGVGTVISRYGVCKWLSNLDFDVIEVDPFETSGISLVDVCVVTDTVIFGFGGRLPPNHQLSTQLDCKCYLEQ
jgi:hypothetical protein